MINETRFGSRLAAIDPIILIIGTIIMVAALILYIYMSQYIYKDAVKRDLNAELWLLIAFFFPIVSWIVYFIVRDVKPDKPIKKPKE